MTRPTATIPRGTWQVAGRGLFKTDHPRDIDRFIDYFGGDAPWSGSTDAPGHGSLRELAPQGGRHYVLMAG